MMNQLKKLMLFRLLTPVIQFQKSGYNTKIAEIEKKLLGHDHDKYITTQEYNKLTTEKCTARLTQAKLETKADMAGFVKKADEIILMK